MIIIEKARRSVRKKEEKKKGQFFVKFLVKLMFEIKSNLPTLVVSFPEKAPPPWAPQPPYVSMIIFLPVRPASPCRIDSNW